MDERGLYATLLGLSGPWEVQRVEVRERESAVHVWVGESADAAFVCPECGDAATVHDRVERRWRHLDTCQFQTLVHAAVPRVRCSAHGVKTIAVPWAERHARFTLLFERLALAWLKEATPAAVARRLGLSWDECRGIMERAVRRGLARRASAAAPRLGIDEKSFLKRHQYVSVVVDLDGGRVLDVLPDRKASSLVPYFTALSPDERAGIEAIVMDMWEPYRTTVRLLVPEADRKIVFDKFHVLMHVQQAVDTVRKQEHKALAAEGDTRLTRTKYQWLRHPDSFTDAGWAAFAALRQSDLKTARAWAMKESLRRLWDYTYVGAARTFFRHWYRWAIRSQLPPMVKVARMLKAHLDNILTYLIHRVTNAMTEGLNAKIQWIKYASRGYRDRDAFKMAILFHCGGLDLEPRLP